MPPTSVPTRERFLEADAYRARREWQRYEGTAQRELFRQLRERFLARHSPVALRALDVGSGPGRFTSRLGSGPRVRRVALDLSREMLRELEDRWGRSVAPRRSLPELVQGDGIHLPFRDHSFDLVAALGNLVGFAGGAGNRLVDALEQQLALGGTLLLELAPGSGERSRYLHRLPATSVARLLRSSPSVVAARIAREGFAAEPRRKKLPGDFRRVDPAELRDQLVARGLKVEEIVCVAPALGPDNDRTSVVAKDPKAWDHLLQVEEILGRGPERWGGAAAVLLAAVREGVPTRASEG